MLIVGNVQYTKLLNSETSMSFVFSFSTMYVVWWQKMVTVILLFKFAASMTII